MDTPTIDRATSEQLIAELMWRKSFFGVVVAVRAGVSGAIPQPTDPVEVCSSQKLSVLFVARILAQATEKVITRLAAEEMRKSDNP
jgi:hypothetical protein